MARANAFDPIRLALAMLVVWAHGWYLLGVADPLAGKDGVGAGDLGVMGFFGLSGFLVTASWDRSAGVGGFLAKRALRILPGYWACLVVVAFAFAPLLYSLRGLPDYLWGEAGRFVWANAALRLRRHTVGEAVASCPTPESLDGSLWTIWPEACCYLLTAVAGLLGATRQNRPLLAGLAGAVGAWHAATVVRPDTVPLAPTLLALSHTTPLALAYLVGACLHAYRDEFVPNGKGGVLAGLVVGAAWKFGGLALVAPVAWPVAVVYLAHAARLPLRWDLSYGTYLYHYPAFQVLSLTPLRDRPAIFLPAGLAAALACACLSWLLVERPALGLKRRVRRPNGPAGTRWSDPAGRSSMPRQ